MLYARVRASGNILIGWLSPEENCKRERRAAHFRPCLILSTTPLHLLSHCRRRRKGEKLSGYLDEETGGISRSSDLTKAIPKGKSLNRRRRERGIKRLVAEGGGGGEEKWESSRETDANLLHITRGLHYPSLCSF